jgi:D-xylose reductase
MYTAIKQGKSHIDTACRFGNEKEIGEGIKRAIQESIYTRSQLLVTNKLWNTHHDKNHVTQAVAHSLALMQLEYFDLYSIHFPISLKFVPFGARYTHR